MAYGLGVDGNLARGLVNRLLVTVRAEFLVTTLVWGYFLESRYVYGAVGENETDSELFIRNVGFLFPRNRILGLAVAIYERSLRQRFHHRLFPGLGAGLQLARSADYELLLGAVAVLERTSYYQAMFVDRPDETSTIRTVPRIALRFNGRYRLGSPVIFFHDIYVHPAVTDPSDIGVQAELSLELPLNKNITARTILDYNYSSVHPVGTSASDLMLLFGVSLRGGGK